MKSDDIDEERVLYIYTVFYSNKSCLWRPEPELRSGELPEARQRQREGASGAGRGWGVACASALGRGIRRELEGCWKYYASCRAQPATIT